MINVVNYTKNLYENQTDDPEEIDTTLKIYHDIKNLLFIISSYIELGEYEKALQKIRDICQEGKTRSNVRQILSSFILNKIDMARSNGISFCLTKGSGLFASIDEFDLCVILGNTIDNAIEACNQIHNDFDKYINMILFRKGKYLHFIITNPIDKKVKVKGHKLITTKKGKYIHGLGIGNVKSAVEKYNGKVKITQKDRTFSVHIKIRND